MLLSSRCGLERDVMIPDAQLAEAGAPFLPSFGRSGVVDLALDVLLRFAQDFACGLPLRSRPQNGSTLRTLPAVVAAGQRIDIAEAHPLQHVGRERRAAAASAVEHDLGVFLGGDMVDFELQYPARNGLRARNDSVVPVLAFA